MTNGKRGRLEGALRAWREMSPHDRRWSPACSPYEFARPEWDRAAAAVRAAVLKEIGK